MLKPAASEGAIKLRPQDEVPEADGTDSIFGQIQHGLDLALLGIFRLLLGLLLVEVGELILGWGPAWLPEFGGVGLQLGLLGRAGGMPAKKCDGL